MINVLFMNLDCQAYSNRNVAKNSPRGFWWFLVHLGELEFNFCYSEDQMISVKKTDRGESLPRVMSFQLRPIVYELYFNLGS